MRKLLVIVLCLFSLFILTCCKEELPVDNNKEENNTKENEEEQDNNEEEKIGSLFIHYVFNYDKKELVEEIKVIEEYEIIEPERVGYIFDGWYVDESFDVELDLSVLTMPTGKDDTIVMAYADWRVAQFMVKFMRDGYLMTTQLVKYGESAREPSVPIKAGYRFVGWDKDISAVSTNLVVHGIYVKVGN